MKLTLKKKEAAPAAAAPAAAGAMPAAAPAFAMPASGGSGGIILELRGASVHIAEVVIKPQTQKQKK
jgi:CO dehydrogenase/acetyl-CoA synthase beta subunit